MKVTKEITFDSAHMLSNYEGKCANLHGHTYKLQVTLNGDVNNESCMVLDFNVFKDILNNTIMEKFDHAVIFSAPGYRNDAEHELYEWCRKYSKRYVVVPGGKSTCEDIAPYIRKLVSEKLEENNIDAFVSVRLWETPTSFAEC